MHEPASRIVASAGDEWPGAGEADHPEAVAQLLRQAVASGDPGAEGLLKDLADWEGTRARLVAGAGAEHETGGPSKGVVFFDGLPGAGKTTHVAALAAAVGALHLSMARFAEAREVSQHERRVHQLATDTLHRTDLAFLDEVKRHPGRWVILEKFPRTPVEAVALVRAAREQGWRLEVVHLFFPSDPLGESVRRQLERGLHHGKEITPPQARRRALTSLARGSAGRWTLRDLGVPIHWVDSSRPQAENDVRIRAALGLDFEALPFELASLQLLDEVSRAIGIEAWLASGGFYRPFWNGIFGPHQLPTDLDVAVDREEEVEPLRQALMRADPRRRWSVACPSTRLRRRHGIDTAGAREAKGFSTLLHRAGAVRWRGDRLEVHLAEGAEAALRNGWIRLNPRLLERLSPEARAAAIARAGEKLGRILGDYPGLAIEPDTAARLGGDFATHRPRPLVTDWKALKHEVLGAAVSAECVRRCRRALRPEERAIAEEILRFHQRSDFRPEPPPRPPRVRLPEPLELLRAAKEARGASSPGSEPAAVDPPPGFASWLHHLGLEADDAPFREWFLDQVHHHAPLGGADPFVRAVLRFELFGLRAEATTLAQSVMHQGWSLERHLAASVLELETDSFAERVPSGHRELRLAMRLAMLFHDTGKRVQRAAPRRHARIGARLWLKHRPAWFPARLVPLVAWMIETHDLFGAFGRGLTEKIGRAAADYDVEVGQRSAYLGALDAQAVRAKLAESGLPFELAVAINKAIWRADVGSIAALRWLLPVADLVEQLILAGREPLRPAGRRRG